MAIKGVDSSIFDDPEMKRALALRDIGRVYRLLVNHGVSQRYLAELVGQSQSEVSEILNGRQVQSYDVLVRVADGLGVSRGAMGLSYGDADEGTPIYEDIDEDMRRRALLAAGAVALFGRPILGEVLELPQRPSSPTPLPDRLGVADVEAMQSLTRALESGARYYGGGGSVLSPVATRAEKLLDVAASDEVKTALATSLADLHNVAAWASFDSHLDDTAHYHFARAMSLGNEGDGFQFAKAAYLAGVSTAERGHYNDGIKFMQLAQMRLGESPRHERTGELAAWINADMACALGHMGVADQAKAALGRARAGWHAPHADDQADMDWVCALAEIHMGRDESVQRLVASSVRHWTGTNDRRQAVLGRITLAQIHVQAGEKRGNEMAYSVLREVRELRSVRARERLGPLADALEARPESEPRQLARLARRVAAV